MNQSKTLNFLVQNISSLSGVGEKTKKLFDYNFNRYKIKSVQRCL